VQRLSGWGYSVQFVVDSTASLPATPSPTVIPFIHYGVVGVNDYQEYESLFCVNSYYVSSELLTRTVLEFDQDLMHVQLKIVSGPDKQRRVRVAGGKKNQATIESLGTDYLRRLELDRVIQAAGRVRFATKPREVLLFHMADLRAELPGCVEVRTPTELRAAMELPDPKDLDRVRTAGLARAQLAAGVRAQDVADALGVSRRTLFRRLKEAESAKSPYIYLYRRFGTPGSHTPSSDGGGS